PLWKSEIQKAVEETANAASERQKAENKQDASEIAVQIKAFVDAYQAQNTKPKRKDKLKRFLDIATVALLFGTALFSGLAWLVFRDQLHVFQTSDTTFKQTMVDANRAWIIPHLLKIREPLKAGEEGN